MSMQQWFTEAKLGIFVHWGIYAVDGVPESWSFYDGIVPHDQYMAQLDRFTGAAVRPGGLGRPVRPAPAPGTPSSPAATTTASPCGTPRTATSRHPRAATYRPGYADALREKDLKVGLYYSHSDWSHPDYASTRKPGRPPEQEDNRYSEVAGRGARTWRPGSASSPTATARSASWPPATGPTCCGSTASGSAARSSGASPELAALIRAYIARRRVQRPHAQRGRLRHSRTGRPDRAARRALGAVPDDQRLVGLPAPRPQPQVARPADPLLHRDHRRGRQPAARRRPEGGRHHPAAAGRAPRRPGGVDPQARRGRVRHGARAARRAPLRAQHPLRRPSHPLPHPATTSRAPRSVYAASSHRSARSLSSAPAPNSPTGSWAGCTMPSACCGSNRPPRRTSTRTRRCSRSNWTVSWSCTGGRAASEPGTPGRIDPRFRPLNAPCHRSIGSPES